MRGLDPRDFALLPTAARGRCMPRCIAEELGMRARARAADARQLLGVRAADRRPAPRLRGTRAVADARARSRATVNASFARACGRRPMPSCAEAGIAPDAAPARALARHALCGPSLRAVSAGPPEVAADGRGRGGLPRGLRATVRPARRRAGRDRQLPPHRLGAHARSRRCRSSTVRGGRRPRPGLGRGVWWFGGAELTPPFWRARQSRSDARIAGPGIIEEAGATTLCRQAGAARLEASGSLVLERQDGPRARCHHARGAAQALISVVREMRATVFRTANSVAIWEAKDFSCGLFDAGLAGGGAVGGHRLARGAAAVVGALGDGATSPATSRPGDVILMNDPYRGGTHLNDVTMHLSGVRRRAAAFFPAVRAHWADVGGMVPGSMSGSATESTRRACASRRSRSSSGAGSTRRRWTCCSQHARARRAARRLPCRHRRLPRGGDAHPRADRALGPRRAAEACALISTGPRRACGEDRRPARRHLPTTRTTWRPSRAGASSRCCCRWRSPSPATA